MENKSEQTTRRILGRKQLFLEQLRKTPIIQIACEKNSIARATIYRWRNQDREFEKAMDEALLEGRLLINDMAESQLIGAIRDRNMTAILAWLKTHHPSYATRVEINARIRDERELTPEQKALIEEALRRASLPPLPTQPSENHEPEQPKS